MPVHRHSARDREELLSYLRVLTEGGAGAGFLELRWRSGAGMRRRFIASGGAGEAARLIATLAKGTDVYIGVALRDGSGHGGKRAIERCGVVHVECDRPDSLRRITGFPAPPTMIVASGTEGHVHAYWSLQVPVSLERAEAGNRALAARLGGDPASCDAARILRPPGTLNHKHDPPREVRMLTHRGEAKYELELLTGSLKLARHIRRPTGPPCRSSLPPWLAAIPADRYVTALTGRSPDTTGKVRCPFHEDGNASLQLYGQNGFYCFGCGRGGTVVDFAALLWGIEPRGSGFVEILRRLQATLGAVAEPAGPPIVASPSGMREGRRPAPRRAGPRGEGVKRCRQD
jgi:RepB DNA-primase from phage plasmid/CHC2 zinc finger